MTNSKVESPWRVASSDLWTRRFSASASLYDSFNSGDTCKKKPLYHCQFAITISGWYVIQFNSMNWKLIDSHSILGQQVNQISLFTERQGALHISRRDLLLLHAIWGDALQTTNRPVCVLSLFASTRPGRSIIDRHGFLLSKLISISTSRLRQEWN